MIVNVRHILCCLTLLNKNQIFLLRFTKTLLTLPPFLHFAVLFFAVLFFAVPE